MSLADTDDVVQALFHEIRQSCGSTFKTYDRRVLPLSDEFEQPALFLRHSGDDDEYAGEDLPLTTIEVEIFIYSKPANDPLAVPDSGLSACVKSLRAAIATIDQRNTLGEAVYRCRIEGRSDYDPGDASPTGQAAAAVTVKILVPDLQS